MLLSKTVPENLVVGPCLNLQCPAQELEVPSLSRTVMRLFNGADVGSISRDGMMAE